MANIKSSIKRIEIAERNRVTNRTRKSKINTLIKRFEVAIENEELDTAKDALKLAEKELRQAGVKGIVHQNKINRLVGRMHRQYNQATA